MYDCEPLETTTCKYTPDNNYVIMFFNVSAMSLSPATRLGKVIAFEDAKTMEIGEIGEKVRSGDLY